MVKGAKITKIPPIIEVLGYLAIYKERGVHGWIERQGDALIETPNLNGINPTCPLVLPARLRERPAGKLGYYLAHLV